MVPGQNHDPEGDLGEDEPDEGDEGRDEEGDEDEGAVGQGGDCAEGQYDKSPGEAGHPADDAQAAFDNGSGGWGGRGGCGGGGGVLLQNGGGRWNILWLAGDGIFFGCPEMAKLINFSPPQKKKRKKNFVAFERDTVSLCIFRRS